MKDLRSPDFWRLFPVELRPAAAPEPVGGGLSRSAVWRFQAAGGTFALRCGARSAFSQLAQRHAAATLAFVPRLQTNLAGEMLTEFAGQIWEISAWIPGAETAAPGDVLASAARGLAAWHGVFRGTAFPNLTPPRPTAAAARRDGWERADRPAGRPPPPDGPDPEWTRLAHRVAHAACKLAPRMPEWLASCARPQPRVVVHGDPRRSNLLFQGGILSGMLDFATVNIDTPLLDLARWCGDAAPNDEGFRRATLAEYARCLPLPDNADRIAAAFQHTGLVLSALNWALWLRSQPDAGAASPRAAAFARWQTLVERLETLAERLG